MAVWKARPAYERALSWFFGLFRRII
jgi:hypothetical protein